MTTAIQVLREIDKLDKIGLDGVCAMLGEGMKDASGAFNRGVGLDPLQIGMVRIFLEPTTATDNAGVLEALDRRMSHLGRVKSRIDLMCALEETTVSPSGETAWDRLLSMARNEDETWGGNSRPANIGWALDDILAAISPPHPRSEA